MKQSTWVWIVVIAILIIGGIFLFRSKSASDSMTATTTSTTDNSGTNGNIVGMKTTLGGIFDDPGSHECDYEQVGTSTRATNVVYISKGKLRGEFRSTVSGTTTLSMVIYDGSNLYVWTEGQPTGKVSVPKTIADLPAAIPEDITSGRILGSSAVNVSWNCHDWSAVPSKLVKPSYVTFN